MKRLIRSALFVPASKPRAIQKAAGLGADMLILDLEDARVGAQKGVEGEPEELGEIGILGDIGALERGRTEGLLEVRAHRTTTEPRHVMLQQEPLQVPPAGKESSECAATRRNRAPEEVGDARLEVCC